MIRLALLSAVLVSAAAAHAEPFDLRVMSFNIRYGSAGDGDNAWDRRRDLVVDTIRECEPHIIGTQETLDFQADYLQEQLPGYARFGMGRDPGGTGERMEVYYRADILDPVMTGNFWLSETPDVPGTSSWESACNRMVTWARFYHRPTNQEFFYFNTHFDHRSADARAQSAILLRERTQTIAGDAPTIVTGDFNNVAGKDLPWQTLTATRFRDAWLESPKRVGPSITWSGFKAPELHRDRRIDWVLVAGPIQVKECHTVTTEKDGRYPSDHFPVVAHLSVFDK